MDKLILYRGEMIKFCKLRRRNLLREVHNIGLFSKLANGGDPYGIIKEGYANRLQIHIGKTWDKTHFLSFSQDVNRAIHFSKGKDDPAALGNITADGFRFPSEQSSWEHTICILVKLEISKDQIRPLCLPYEGVYNLGYNEDFNNALIIDAVVFLNSLPTEERLPSFDNILRSANTDSEWIILPTDPLPPQFGQDIGNSALLANGSEMDVLHYFDDDYFQCNAGGGFLNL